MLAQSPPSRLRRLLASPSGRALAGGLIVLALSSSTEAANAAPGDLDSSFGVGGVQTTVLGPGGQAHAAFNATAIDGAGNIVVAGESASSGLVARYTPSGSPEPTFGDGRGFVRPAMASVEAMDIDADGRIVLIGHDVDSSALKVARLLPSGAIDATFGEGGFVTVTPESVEPNPPSSGDQPPGFENSLVKVDQNGNVIVAASIYHCCRETWDQYTVGENNVALVRYTPNGALDSSFGGGDGVVVTDLGENDLALGIAVQDTSVVLAVTRTEYYENATSGLIRYSADGILDPAFGVAEGFTATTSMEGKLGPIAVDSSGSFVVAHGSSEANILGDRPAAFGAARFTSSGAVDTSFGGGDGLAATYFADSTHYNQVTGIGIDSAGRILVDGYAGFFFGESNQTHNTIVRYTSSGALDTTFGGDNSGYLISSRGGCCDAAGGLAIDESGRIVDAGLLDVGEGAVATVARYSADGILDTDFGAALDPGFGKGIVSARFGRTSDVGRAVTEQEGKTIVAGTTDTGDGTPSVFVARYAPDGTLDPGFGGGDGFIVVPTGIGSSGWSELDVAVDADERIVVAQAFQDVHFKSAVLRFTPDGQLDESFSEGGILRLDEADFYGSDTTWFRPSGRIAMSADGGILLAGAEFSRPDPESDWQASSLAVARYTASGIPDTSFGEAGVLSAHLGDANQASKADDVAFDSQGRIVLAGAVGNEVAVARYTDTGAVDTSFGAGDGIVAAAADPETAEYPVALALGPDDGVVVASHVEGGSTRLTRWTPSGAPDAAFAGGTVDVQTLFFAGDTAVQTLSSESPQVAVDASGRVLVAANATDYLNQGPYFGLARLAPDGSLDPGFGTDGVLTTAIGDDPQSATDQLFGAMLDQQERMVLVGAAPILESGLPRIALARYLGGEAVREALDVSRSGNGSGTVSSSPGGIECGDECHTTYFQNQTVTLTAVAGPGSEFAGWSNCDEPFEYECRISMSTDKAVTATFAAIAHNLTVTIGGSGSGSVSSTPAGISCTASCSSHFSDGESVTLVATAASGSTFAGWSGCNAVAGNECTVSVDADRSVVASFNAINSPPPVRHTVQVSKGGVGTGNVTSTTPAIDCGAICSAQIPAGAGITLVATPAPGSVFAGWAGGGCAGTGPCQLAVVADVAVAAIFDSQEQGAGPGGGSEPSSGPSSQAKPRRCRKGFRKVRIGGRRVCRRKRGRRRVHHPHKHRRRKGRKARASV